MYRCRIACSFLLFLLASSLSFAAPAVLSGRIVDPANAAVTQAAVELVNDQTGITMQTASNRDGLYAFPSLPSGTYTLTARKAGFAPLIVRGVEVSVAGRVVRDLALTLASGKEVVWVQDQSELIQRDSAAVETLIDRQTIERMPINGRSFQSLLDLIPGAVMANARISNQGQYAINGQRSNANNFMVDGVSANFGASFSAQFNQQAAGGLPALTVFGGSQSLVTMDGLEEFRVLTSSYAPEFGRNPGGQIMLHTRRGTNQWHGSAYNYLRNDALDANDWFANANRIRRQPLRQNLSGATISGPLRLPRVYDGRNRSFFFVAYEGQRLRQPQSAITNVIVPSNAARQQAQGALRTVFAAFPVPNSPALPGDPAGFERFIESRSFPSSYDTLTARFDHQIRSNMSAFVRYANAPSETTSFTFANGSNVFQSNNRGLTGGHVWTIRPTLVSDLRLNLSWSEGEFDFRGREVGGAVLPPVTNFFPPGYTNTDRVSVSWNLINQGGNTVSLTQGRSLGNNNRQFNLVENLSLIKGSHQFKFGVDWRRLTPEPVAREFGLTYSFNGVQTALDTGRVSLQVQALYPNTQFLINNYSTYFQDTWRLRKGLTLTYGFRHEVNPAPSGSLLPYSLENLDNPLQARLAPANQRQYRTDWNNFAPRLGMAWSVPKQRDLVLRAGWGMYFDVGNGQALRGYSGFPYNSVRTTSNVPFPVTDPVALSPLPFSTAAPYSAAFFVNPQDLRLPVTDQWNVAIEKGLGRDQTFTASYVGARGRDLLRNAMLRNIPPSNAAAFGVQPQTVLSPELFTVNSTVTITRNLGSSSYNALQLQYQRRLSQGISALAAYTWANSIDNASDEATTHPPDGVPLNANNIFLDNNRGPSDFDIRHQFASALSWDLPHFARNRFATALTKGWGLDGFVRVRSGQPFSVLSQIVDPINLWGAERRVDLTGQPIYQRDPNVAAGVRLNPQAFAVPTSGRQGALGRNAIRGLAIQQLDLSARRDFSLGEKMRLEFRAEAFNVLNHANFGLFGNSFGTPLFGVITGTQARQFGTGATNGGLNPIYQVGGPRSMQLMLRLKF
jgi:hypothetical protein